MPTQKNILTRTIETEYNLRADNDQEPVITAKFITFGEKYEAWDKHFETISPNLEIEQKDVRALINHNSTLVLGRVSAKTLKLELKKDGLYGTIAINPKDSDAVNIYERIKRGDVNQCSFGFEILKESQEKNNNGILYTIEKIRLHEVSIVTFPAYQTTYAEARADLDRISKVLDEIKSWKKELLERLSK